MKQKRYSNEQIVYALKRVQAGEKAAEGCRQMGISEATLYNWKKKYGGMGAYPLLRHPRYHLHFTPTHNSWINQIERWFALLSERQIKRSSHHSVKDLETALTSSLKRTMPTRNRSNGQKAPTKS